MAAHDQDTLHANPAHGLRQAKWLLIGALLMGLNSQAQVSVPDRVAQWQVMNYFPAAHSWERMWTQFDKATIDADFKRIADLHANTVRIILQVPAIGWPTPNPRMLDELAQVVALADSHGLAVQLTLFDHWGSYDHGTESQQWAKTVLAPYRDDRRIAFVELQNEIAPSNDAAMAWARDMLPYLRSLVGRTLVTLSPAAGVVNLALLQQRLGTSQPDFYDFHFYGQPALAYQALAEARRIAGSVPLLIGETGFSTSLSNLQVGPMPNVAALEAYQAYFYRHLNFATTRLGLPAAAPWTLSDFVPGTLATTNETEYSYGLFRVDGSPKPVVAEELAFLNDGTVNLSFNGNFEQGIDTATGRLPAIWRRHHASQATFALDGSTAYSGTSSARISQSTGDATGIPAFFTSPITAIFPGRPCVASVQARGLAATGAQRICLAFFASDGSYLSNVCSPSLAAGATPWTRLEVSAQAPGRAAAVEIHLSSQNNTGTVWFDSVTFR